MRLFLVMLVLLAAARPGRAQWADAFADGDFTADPPWTGADAGWTVAPFDDGHALVTRGADAADTLYLATASAAAYGSWRFTVAFTDVNLSNFNGARIYLVADTDALGGPVHGYYIQLGTNNTDELRLYRQDGTSRRLLAHGPPFLTETTDTLRIAAIRTLDGAWTVTADGAPALTADDATYATSAAFGVWVKHTAPTADAYAFTGFDVDGPAAPPDTTAPVLRTARAIGARRVEAVFSEPVLGCDPAWYTLGGDAGAPIATEGCTPTVAQAALTLVFAHPLADHTRYVLTAHGITDVAGNARDATTATFFVGTLAVPTPGAVVVNEVMYAPPAGVPEYIELFNRSDAWLDLGALALTDAAGPPVPLASAPTPLAPGAYALLTGDGDAFGAAFQHAPPPHTLPGWPALNNGGDEVTLLARDLVIDHMAYSGGAAPGVALERLDPDASAEAFNWAPSSAANGGTPGAQNSRYAPDRTPPGVLFAEEVADITVEVTFTEPPDPASVVPDAFRTGDVPAVEAAAVESAVWRLTFAAPPESPVLTVRGVRDRTGNVLAEATTPLARRPRPGDVVVNELLPAPLADPHDGRPDQPEYVELYNRAPYPVSLRGTFWTGAEDETGTADTLVLTTAPVLLAPGGYAVVFAAPRAATDSARTAVLAQAFPAADLDAATTVLLPLDRTTLRLTDAGDVVHLHRADRVPLERLAYLRTWHRPDLPDVVGAALERLTPEAPADDPQSWTSAVHPDGGTPGAPNSVRLSAPAPAGHPGLTVTPTTFSPDADGHDDVAALAYRLRAPAGLLRVRIFDAHGRPVRTLTPAALATTEGRLAWDGFDDAGRTLPIGIYVVHLEAVDAGGGTVEVYKQPVVLARRLD